MLSMDRLRVLAELRQEHPGVEVLFRLGETDEALAALPGARGAFSRP